jgi:hypothetical protein
MSLRIDSEAWIRREGGEEVPKARLVAAGTLFAQRLREQRPHEG